MSTLCVTYGSYLITKVAVNYRGFSSDSRAPLALCSLMNHCDDPALFAHLEHMIPKILSAVDYSYQAFAFTLFQSENWQKYGFVICLY